MKTKVQKVTELQSEKDETDTHIAILTALDYKPNEIIVTGITGGRLDHYEAALHDICRLQLKNPVHNIFHPKQTKYYTVFTCRNTSDKL